jgi:hypothetical protein
MCAMKTYKTEGPEEANPELAIRPRELEIFEAFTRRALDLVDENKDNAITDACRLVEAALKAVRGDAPAAPSGGGGEALQQCLNDIDKIYEELHAEKAAAASSGEGQP